MLKAHKNATFSKYLTTLIVIAPLFQQYILIFDFILLPEYLLAPLLIKTILSKKIKINKIFIFLILYRTSLLLLCITSLHRPPFDSYIFWTTYSRFSFYAIFIIVFHRYFDTSYGLNLLTAVALLNSIYAFSQLIVFDNFSIALPWHLPFLSVKYGTQLIENQGEIFVQFGYRPSGLFSEPAHFSQYIGFAYIALLFGTFHSKSLVSRFRIVFLAIYTLALLLSGSGTGFAIVAIFSVLYFVFPKKQGLHRTRVPLIAFGGAVAVAAGWLFDFSALFHGLSRIEGASETSALYVRVIRPIEVYLSLSPLDMIFGVGYGNYAKYVIYSGLMNEYEESINIAWTSTAGFILVGGGALSFVLICVFFCNLFTKSQILGKSIVLFVFIQIFFNDFVTSLFFVMAMSFATSLIMDARVGSQPVYHRYRILSS